MVNKTYISKCTTIIKDSEFNFGLNPIAQLNYGQIISRALIYFDIKNIKEKIDDKTYCDISKLKHTLKLTNCGSIDVEHFNEKIFTNDSNIIKERATSFDIILFTIPQKWDAGRGFDYGHKLWVNGKPSYSKEGCNWFQSTNGYVWPEEGIFSNETLSHEYDKFSNNEESIIIGRQHFDFGNENFEIDITNIVNDFVSGKKENNGIGIAFSPLLENTKANVSQYVGFFTNNTNTIFEPYVETTYKEYIKDDRSCFYLNKINKLYLYSNIGGNLENLDELPICTINETSYPVKQITKGVYCAEIILNSDEYYPNTILYDVWSNLIYNGIKLTDVEMEFVALSSNGYFKIGNDPFDFKKISPLLYGINDNENIIQSDVRVINVDYKIAYSNKNNNIIDSEYRIYVKDGNREIDIINFEPIERLYLNNYFYIDTNSLIPNKYYIDIKINYMNNTIIHKNVLTFNVVNNVTNFKN